MDKKCVTQFVNDPKTAFTLYVVSDHKMQKNCYMHYCSVGEWWLEWVELVELLQFLLRSWHTTTLQDLQ